MDVEAKTDNESRYAWAPLPTREQQLEALEKTEFDILVIGGGATGCGVALDSVSRGMWQHRPISNNNNATFEGLMED